jgi:hypothetical protein
MRITVGAYAVSSNSHRALTWLRGSTASLWTSNERRYQVTIAKSSIVTIVALGSIAGGAFGGFVP